MKRVKSTLSGIERNFPEKPLSLSRINLAQLRNAQSLRDRKVSVRYPTAVLSAPINFVQNIKLTIEWQNLKEELKGIRK